MIAIALLMLLVAPSPKDRPAGQTLDDFVSTGDSTQVVLLRPGEWSGQRLPLLRWLPKREEIQKGQWHAVLYRSDCSACERLIESLLHDGSGGGKLLLIELPHSANGRKRESLLNSDVCCDRLPYPPKWIAAVPSEFVLINGVVSAVPPFPAGIGDDRP